MDLDRSRRAVRLARALPLIVVVSVSAPTAQSVRLNAPLPQPLAGDVSGYEISPDGSRVVYRADQTYDDVYEAFSAPVDGSAAPVRLNAPPAPSSLLAVTGFAIGAAGRVVLFGDLRANGTFELYTVPIDGSALPAVLSGTMVSGGSVFAYQLTPDGTRVVYRADALVNNRHELFSVPVDGSTAPARLDPLGRVASELYRIAPASDSVVFATQLNGAEGNRQLLHVVPVDASALPLLLADSGESEIGFDTYFAELGLASDGLHAAYVHVDALLDRGDARLAGLFGLTADGSQAPAQLHVQRHSFTLPDYAVVKSRVVYTEPNHDLFTIESDGTGRALLATQAGEFAIAPDESRVAFVAGSIGARTLYVADVDGGSPPTALVGPGALESPRFSSGSDLVFFIATVPSTTFRGLFSVPALGGTPVLQNGPVLAGERGVLDFAISPTGDVVVYREDRVVDDVFELFSVGLDLVTHQLSGPMPATGDVASYGIASDGQRVVYAGDQNSESCTELFGTPIDGSTPFVQYNPPMPIGPVLGDVAGFRVTPDESRVVYLASQEIAFFFDLFSADSDGQGAPTRLTAPLPVTEGDVFDDFVVSPSGATVVFRTGLTSGNDRLYACPAAGGGAQVLLDSDTARLEGPYLLDPAESFVVYRAKSPDVLRRADLDGSTPAFDLAAAAYPSDIEFQLTPDGSAVIYTAEREMNGRVDLHRVSSAGGVSSLLNVPSSSLSDVLSFRLIPDGSRVVYRGPQDGPTELFSVPSDGSAPPVKLNAPLASLGSVHAFSITPSGVLFNAQQAATNRVDLFCAPHAGGTPALRLTAMVTGHAVLDDFTPSSEGTLAFYRADVTTIGAADLFVVPTDASASPVKLSAALPLGGDVASFALSPDEGRIVYLADQRVDEVFELFSAPATGGPVLSLMTLPEFADVTMYRFDPASQNVVYLADAVRDETFDLWRVPLDASRLPRRVNARLPAGSDVEGDFVPLADGGIVYRADLESVAVIELFRFLDIDLDPLLPMAEPTRTRSVVR